MYLVYMYIGKERQTYRTQEKRDLALTHFLCFFCYEQYYLITEGLLGICAEEIEKEAK